MKLLLLLLCGLHISCATTTFYRDSLPIARFQGDMTDMEFMMDSKGAIVWRAADVSHSAATLAQGQAATNKISATGFAIATSGIVQLLK